MRNKGDYEHVILLAIEGKIIKQVTETKFIVVTLGYKLSWKPHI